MLRTRTSLPTQQWSSPTLARSWANLARTTFPELVISMRWVEPLWKVIIHHYQIILVPLPYLVSITIFGIITTCGYQWRRRLSVTNQLTFFFIYAEANWEATESIYGYHYHSSRLLAIPWCWYKRRKSKSIIIGNHCHSYYSETWGCWEPIDQ